MSRVFQKIVESKGLQDFLAEQYPEFVKTYVPGESLEEIKPIVQKNSAEGYRSILHPIQLHREIGPYFAAVHFLGNDNRKASIALRPTMEGNLDDLVLQASRAEIRIELDMRDSTTTGQTIDCYKRIIQQYPNTMLCLQANLRRTEQDINSLLGYNPQIRLVKGVFKETEEIAYQKRKDIDRNYLQLAKKLLLHPRVKLALATHDQDIIGACLEFARMNKVPKENFEFQMTYGIKQELQENLNRQGFTVGRYIVYGKDWLPYVVNRLWERKGNILPLLQKVLKR